MYKGLLIGIVLQFFATVKIEAQDNVLPAAKLSNVILQDFMNQRFGMFIHWGPVALRGTEIGWSRVDSVKNNNQVQKAEYDDLYKEFNPVLFDADAWVKTAKDAGMKYLTITARHHDGFCLWPSAFTDFDIASTPYKKDIVGALQKACKKQGIKFCIYYSVLDWHHPDYPNHSPQSKVADPKSDMNRYITFMKNQLKELITNYDPYMLWFDGAWESPWTNEMGKDMYDYLKKIKPTLIINNRLGKEIAGVVNKTIDHTKMIGDYDTPEQSVGKMNMEIPWESCFTICNQWAWKPNDKLKPLKECLDIIAQTAGGNGNLLMNVGPMPDGRIEARQVQRLKEMGDWLKVNGESIYGTKGGPWVPAANYTTTRKGNKIYVHVLEVKDNKLVLPALPNKKIIKAYMLKGATVSFTQDGNITLDFKGVSDTTVNATIVLEINGNAENIPVIQ
ncbi:MAG: alpha-L-fucosidase [Ferruginibacter sp.]